MPAVFDKLGVRFAYPENWILDEQDMAGGRAVTVASPGTAFWWLAVHRADEDFSQVAKAVLDGLRQEYDNIDVEAIGEMIAGRRVVGYDVNFYCLDLTNTAQIRGFQTQQATYMMLWQAEDREFDRVHPVFRAMTTSLIQSAS